MMTLPVISVLFGISAFLFTVGIGAVPKRSILDRDNTEEWIFTNGFQRVYSAVLGDTDPVRISKAFGLEYDKYMVDCSVVGTVPNMEKEAMMRVVGVFCFIFGILMSVVLMSPYPIVLGCIVYFALASAVPRGTHQKALSKKRRISNDLSRFVDLFLSALEINFPVEIAITQTAESLPCELSTELLEAMAETQVGAKNWQQALEALARKYEIDQLSDFVLDIITAYNKGVSVTEAVARKSFEIKQSSLLNAKEKTAKMTNTILVPLVFFKILPLIIVLMLPIVMEIMQFFG